MRVDKAIFSHLAKYINGVHMDTLTKMFKALSDKSRLRMLSALMNQNEMCACQLTELIQVSGATASRHLGILHSAGLVESRKEGRWVYYRLSKENHKGKDLLQWVSDQLKRDPEAVDDVQTIKKIMSYNPEDLCRRQRGETCCP